MEVEIPDCYYPNEPSLVRPSSCTPRHTLYLSNLDDQKFLRFSSKYLYVYKRPVAIEALKASLSRVLVEYHYPLAGRLRRRSSAGGGGEGGDGHLEDKLEVDCNAEGAVVIEAHTDLTAEKFLQGSASPNRSWRKLQYRVESRSFVDTPPLVVQVTHLTCGSMIMTVVVCHCLCDALASSQFLHAWALLTTNPNATLPTNPLHNRCVLKPREPPRIDFSHPEFSCPLDQQLKKQCVPSLKCTSFEVLAWHVWRSWIAALEPPPSLPIKLLFAMNVRGRLDPPLPSGYFGNGFVLACAETMAQQLVSSNEHYGVKLVQKAKETVSNEYVRSVIDLVDVRGPLFPNLSSSLVISSLTSLGMEDLDFGEGRPLHMGTLTSETYCLFLPVIGDLHASTILMSVPQGIADRFRHHCLINHDHLDEEDGTGTVH